MRATVLAGRAVEALQRAEVGEHVAIGPARGASLFPAVEVLVLAADENESVDRAGAPQPPSACPHDTAPRRSLRRLGGKQPRETLIVDGAEITDRKLEPDIAVAAASLEQ